MRFKTEMTKKKLIDLAQKLGASQLLKEFDAPWEIASMGLRSIASSRGINGCNGQIYISKKGNFFFATTQGDVLYIAKFL